MLIIIPDTDWINENDSTAGFSFRKVAQKSGLRRFRQRT